MQIPMVLMLATVLGATAIPPIDPAIAMTSLTPWSSFDEGYRCTVERSFGPKPGLIAFKFGRTAFPGFNPGADILIRSTKSYRSAKQVTIAFDGGRESVTEDVRIVAITKANITLVNFSPDQAKLWRGFDGARQMTVALDGHVVATLALTSTAKAKQAAEDCAEKQLVAFGATPAQAQAALGRAPAAAIIATPAHLSESITKAFSPASYPESARDKGATGTVITAYRVGVNGRALGCRAIKSSRNLALDQASCNILSQRVHFEPARDPAGQPVETISSLQIRWAIPSDGDLLDNVFVGGFIGAGQGGGIVN